MDINHLINSLDVQNNDLTLLGNWDDREVSHHDIIQSSAVSQYVKNNDALELIEIIIEAQIDQDVSSLEFQVWILAVDEDRVLLTCEDGYTGTYFTQEFEKTGNHFKDTTLWVVGGVIIFPEEY